MALKDPESPEWKVLYAVAITLDIVEPFAELLLTEFGGAPEFIEEFADPIIGICFGVWFQIRGVSMIKRPGRLLAMILGDLAEQLSLNTAPGWFGDVWYIHKTVKEEWAAEQASLSEPGEDEPLNQNGIRRPPVIQKPLNQGGVRLPNGGV